QPEPKPSCRTVAAVGVAGSTVLPEDALHQACAGRAAPACYFPTHARKVLVGVPLKSVANRRWPSSRYLYLYLYL
ncbi:hypothetical protein P7K49_007121, partial [Saguinus oedipus]